MNCGLGLVPPGASFSGFEFPTEPTLPTPFSSSFIEFPVPIFSFLESPLPVGTVGSVGNSVCLTLAFSAKAFFFFGFLHLFLSIFLSRNVFL